MAKPLKTQCFQGIKSDGVRPVLVVEGYHHPVVVEENGVDKRISHLGLCQLPTGNPGFQFFRTAFCGLGYSQS